MAITNFGEQFAGKVLRKFFQTAVTPAITNQHYEGQIKQSGDRVNILSFLSNIALGDYVAGTDMTTQALYDTEDQLTVSQRKYFSFPIDRLEELFSYADDLGEALTDNASNTLSEEVDRFVLGNANESKAGNWLGINLRIAGGGATNGTECSIASTATGGTLSITADDEGGNDTTPGESAVENTEDGRFYYCGFTANDVGKPIRCTSGKTWATPWYKITAVTDSITASITNWDGATAGVGDIPTGDVLRMVGGGSGDDERTYEQNRDDKIFAAQYVESGAASGWGWEFQAATATQVTQSNVYDVVTLLAEKLDRYDIPADDRHLTVPPQMMAILRQASELQPAIAMAYEGVVLNGRIMRIGGFDVHMATGARVSTRASHTEPLTQASSGTSTSQGAGFVGADGVTGFLVLANHISFCTFANKWSESRIIDAEDQFARKYQGLNLYGAKVPALRRSAGATLFATF